MEAAFDPNKALWSTPGNDSKFSQNLTEGSLEGDVVRYVSGSSTLGYEIYTMINLALQNVIEPVLSVWALFSCVINITVFSRMGLKDGVTQNFLILSISDGTLALLLAVLIVYDFMDRHNVFGDFSLFGNAFGVFKMLMAVKDILVFSSIYITAVIAVVRCCCVTIPFDVRRIITPRRQLIVILLLEIANILTFILGFMKVYMPKPPNMAQFLVQNATNTSAMARPRMGMQGSFFVDMFKTVSFLTFLGIIIVSIIILIISLKKVSKFRNIAMSGETKETENGSNVKNAAAKKETQVIKNILSVLLIFVAFNVPATALYLLRVFVAKEDRNQIFELMLIKLITASLLLNTGGNIFVYFTSNTQYRQKLLLMFGVNQKDRQ